jgi:TatD DNase family protein
MIDSHCHLDFDAFKTAGIDALVARMAAAGVSHALCISVDLEHFPEVLALAEAHPELYATVGVHPDYEDCEEPTVDRLVALAAHPRVVGIGETGLDYFRLQREAVDWQRERFRIHIRAAIAANKPLIVHSRNAPDDTLAILREEGAERCGGVLHCFTESLEMAEAAMALGFYISFSGIVSFKNAKALKAIAEALPLDYILIETDAPYLAPVPHRGERNEPAFVRHVAEEIARLRGVSLAEIDAVTTANTRRLFRI